MGIFDWQKQARVGQTAMKLQRKEISTAMTDNHPMLVINLLRAKVIKCQIITFIMMNSSERPCVC
jgi:hypothetical protein